MFRTATVAVGIAATAFGMVTVARVVMTATPAPAAVAGPARTTVVPAFRDGPAVGPTNTVVRTSRPRVATPAPAVSRAWTWDDLAACESRNRWDAVRGPYQGGLQFDARTWDHYAPAYGYPADAQVATRAQQIVVAERVLADQGAKAWPTCGPRVGLTGNGAGIEGLPSAGPPDDVAD